jgi:hypothetical protein
MQLFFDVVVILVLVVDVVFVSVAFRLLLAGKPLSVLLFVTLINSFLVSSFGVFFFFLLLSW